MTRLMHGLFRFRVRPYYLYQCDPISGSSHFRTPIETGLGIIRVCAAIRPVTLFRPMSLTHLEAAERFRFFPSMLTAG